MKRIVVTLVLLVSINYSYSVAPEPSCPQKRFGLVVEFNQTRHGSFDQAVSGKEAPIVVVDFYSDSCGPCKQLAPRIKELAKELPDVKFMKVNVSTNNALANKYGIKSIPQLLFFKDGNLQKGETLRGNQPKDTIKKTIKKLS